MARINIEDSLFKDKRFTDLCIKLSSRRLAIGALVEAWILAQQHVSILNPKGLIPKEDWIDQDISNEIITCKLAVESEGIIEIVGGEKNFAWLVQKKEAASKGGTARSENAKRSDAGRMPDAKLASAAVIPLPPTPTLSPTLSQDPDQTEDIKEKPFHPLIILWNNNVTKLSKVFKSNSDREKGIKKIWKENTPEEWEIIIRRLDSSDFCNGINDRKWKANFDFLLKPGTFSKALEGTYDNRTGTDKKRFGSERDTQEVSNEFAGLIEQSKR